MDSDQATRLSKEKLGAHIEALLASDLEDQALLDEFVVLGNANGHLGSLSHLWAPASYRRNPEVFAPFVTRRMWMWAIQPRQRDMQASPDRSNLDSWAEPSAHQVTLYR